MKWNITGYLHDKHVAIGRVGFDVQPERSMLIDALEDWIPYIYCESDSTHFVSKNWYVIHNADGTSITAEEIRLSKGLEPSRG